MMTPLQQKVSELIEAFEERRGRKLSGRELSTMLGKSRNHISQIMNDGLVPSGEVVLRLGEILGADAKGRRDLLIAAMKTKAAGRSRDTFWLRQALAITNGLAEEIDRYRRFLDEKGELEEFDAAAGDAAPDETGDADADSGEAGEEEKD